MTFYNDVMFRGGGVHNYAHAHTHAQLRKAIKRHKKMIVHMHSANNYLQLNFHFPIARFRVTFF